MFNYTTHELHELSLKHKFNRDSLEKVLRLSEILHILNQHNELKNNYVLKGGTAINLCFFDFPRLSVDIDLDFNGMLSKEDTLNIREKHKKIIPAILKREGYIIDDASRYSYILDAYILKYTNTIGRPDNIKLEINYINRTHIFEPEMYKINSKIIKPLSVFSLNIIEIYASKIAALIGRTTTRDLYDVYMIIQYKKIEEKDLELLKKSSIFYIHNSNDLLSIEKLLEIAVNKINDLSFNTVKRSLLPLLSKDYNLELDDMKKKVVEFLQNLFVLTANEHLYEINFLKHIYEPSLLFDNKDIQDRISKHPMSIWKMTSK